MVLDEIFPHYKPMADIDTSMADIDTSETLLHTKYRSSGPCGFREEVFFLFLSHCKPMETIDLRVVAKFDPRDMAGTIYVEDH